MIVRPVKATDAPDWLRMRMALWPDSDSAEENDQIETFLSGTTLPTLQAAFVCEVENGRVCGLIEVSIHTSAPGCETDHIGYLEAWHVDAGWRGQGIGRALVAAAEAWAKAQGCLEMASDTTPFYPISPAAHAALGYEEVERYFRKGLG